MRAYVLLFGIVLSMLFIITPVQDTTSHYLIIVVNEVSGVSRYNYTFPIHIHLVDYPDISLINPHSIGFVLNNEPLYYYVYSFHSTVNVLDMVVYVRVPELLAHSNITIYMYYNTTAYIDYSDPYKVFDYFNDFVDPALLNSGYVYLHDSVDSVTISDSYLHIHVNTTNTYGGSFIILPCPVNLQDSEIIVSGYVDSRFQSYPDVIVGINDGSTFTRRAQEYPANGYGGVLGYDVSIDKFTSNSVEVLNDSGYNMPSSFTFSLHFARRGADLYMHDDNFPYLSAGDTDYTSFDHYFFFVWGSDTASGGYIDLYVDKIMVRHVVADDPEITIIAPSGKVISSPGKAGSNVSVNVNVVPYVNRTIPFIVHFYTDLSISIGILIAMSFILYIALFKDKHRIAIYFMIVLMLVTAVVGIGRTSVLVGEYYYNNTLHYVYKFNPLSRVYAVLIVVEALSVFMILFDPVRKRREKKGFVLFEL
jgi:hypothetical protein